MQTPLSLIYIPLDDRPCNRLYPQWLAQLQPNIILQIPPAERLGHKKVAADVEWLWHWLAEKIALNPETIAILSIEMLIYGGLLPSRLHHHSPTILQQRLDRIKALKQDFPRLKIFASNLLMRCPTYDSAEEEPDYYAQWGAALFRWGWLQDRHHRSLLTPAEETEWEGLKSKLPTEILEDYGDRRRKNLGINCAVIDLVKLGVIDYLSLPQDDAAPYGFTAMDQGVIAQHLRSLNDPNNNLNNDPNNDPNLGDRILSYPGADEVGCTLLARAYLAMQCDPFYAQAIDQEIPQGIKPIVSPKIYPLYATPLAKTLIPRYEDRSLQTTVEAHIQAAGAILAATPEEADLILALNTPARIMQESWEQNDKDASYETDRNLTAFVATLQTWINSGKPVALADVAFSNGGETALIQTCIQAQILDRLLAYAGWNTCGNTVGTTVATAILAWHSTSPEARIFNLLSRLLEDWLYQAIVRQNIIAESLPALGASYYEFAGEDVAIAEAAATQIQTLWQTQRQNAFLGWDIEAMTIAFPWQRMFEIHLDLKLREPNLTNEL